MASKYRRGSRGIWQLKWFDEHGRRRQASTGTTDTRLAERLRQDKEREVEARRSGLVDDRTEALRVALQAPFREHVSDYLADCRGRRQASRRIQGKEKQLGRAEADLGLRSLADLSAGQVRGWLFSLRDGGMAPATVNEYRCTLNAFLNWCVKDGRLRENLIQHVPPVAADGDRRRDRRALTESEVERLLAVAARQDREHAGSNWAPRHPVYLTALLTGLRHGELRQICWQDVDLDQGRLLVREEVGKARRADEVPLHPKVVDALASLPRGRATDPVFSSVPTLATFRKDCGRAGIAVRDEAGRTVDFHSFRMTFGTWLQREAVPPSVAQRLMRHASFRTTEKYYTDLRLHDLEQAVKRLDVGSAEISPGEVAEDLRATGTADGVVVPTAARHQTCHHKCHQTCHQLGHDTLRDGASPRESSAGRDRPSANDKPRREAGLCDTVLGRARKRVIGFEPTTFTLAT